MQEVQADIIVQLTADCPLIDSEIIDQLVRIYATNDFDHVSNTILRSYPDGLAVQVSSLPILEKCYALCDNDKDRDHPFYTIRKNRGKIKPFQSVAPDELCGPQR